MGRETPQVLVLLQNTRNQDLLTQFLEEKEGYIAKEAGTLDELDELLDQGECFSSALLDITDFDSRIWQHCETLRRNSVPLSSSPPNKARARIKSPTPGGPGTYWSSLWSCRNCPRCSRPCMRRKNKQLNRPGGYRNTFFFLPKR